MAINGCPLLLMGEPQGNTLIICMYGCIAIVELYFNGITNYNSYITTLLYRIAPNFRDQIFS